MDDLEMTKLCGDAMGYQSSLLPDGTYANWQPLSDDAQAMALVKRLRIKCEWTPPNEYTWMVYTARNGKSAVAFNADLNRAIVECAAQMQPGLSGGQELKTAQKPDEQDAVQPHKGK